MELKFRTLEADEIDIRVGRVIDTEKFKGVALLLYKNARVDMDILDETVGALGWKREHTRDNSNCIVSIYDTDKKEWVSKEDTGTENKTEKEKSVCSDSFKRACVNWGIGRELYSADRFDLIIPCELVKDSKGQVSTKKGVSWEVSEIEYNDKRKISKIVISEVYKRAKKIVFEWSENATQKSKQAKPVKAQGKETVKDVEPVSEPIDCCICGKPCENTQLNNWVDEKYPSLGRYVCSKPCWNEARKHITKYEDGSVEWRD